MQKESEKFADSNIMEGIVSVRAVAEAMESGISDRKIERLWITEEHKKAKGKEFGWLSYLSKGKNFPIELKSEAALDAITVGNTHGGLVAFCTPRTIPVLSDTSEIAENGFYVMLDGIEDPYNFGYALRSLYAAGADGVILSPRNWMTAAGIVARASAGASERFPMFLSETGQDVCAVFRRKNYKILCADIENSISMYDADLKKPLFLIVGGEKRGISRAVLEKADAVIRLDYARPFHGALSAASAASILGYEVFRQNRT